MQERDAKKWIAVFEVDNSLCQVELNLEVGRFLPRYKTISGVCQARCWPASTAIICPVTLRAFAR